VPNGLFLKRWTESGSFKGDPLDTVLSHARGFQLRRLVVDPTPNTPSSLNAKHSIIVKRMTICGAQKDAL
jgi:hypothetical protein